MPSISIDQEALDCLARGWRNSVVIKLLGKPLAFHVQDRKIREMWKPIGSFVTIDLPNGYSIVCFEQEQNFYGALTCGPLTIFCQCLMVKHWLPDFNLVKDSIKTICTWVRLSNLLILLYDEKVIRCIASSLGNPIRVDKNTLYTTREKFAQVCIELDLNKPLQGAILVNREQLSWNMKDWARFALVVGGRATLLIGALCSLKHRRHEEWKSSSKEQTKSSSSVATPSHNQRQPEKTTDARIEQQRKVQQQAKTQQAAPAVVSLTQRE
ncbi:LOW QUALITY PROTEIN: hypothetical protein V2J09_021729 [Rumex salicifolius]